MELKFMESVKKINDELSVAGQLNPEQLQQASTQGYKSILNLRSPEEEGFVKDEQKQAEAAKLQYVNIPVKPDGMTEELTDKVLEQIDRLPKPLLIVTVQGGDEVSAFEALQMI